MSNFITSLVRFFYPFGEKRTVLRGPVRGYKFIVQPGMGFTYALGADASNMEFLKRRISPGDVIYDIGANRGQTVLPLSRITGKEGQVIAFEPMPDLIEQARQNCRLNEIQNVTFRCAAVSDRSGTAQFEYSTIKSTQGKLSAAEETYTVASADKVEVKTIALDEAISNGLPAPDVMKIDVEGAAAMAFRGARSLLDEESPSIYIELHGPEEQAAVQSELLACGYTAETLDGERVEDVTSGWYSPLWCYKA